MSQTTFKVVLNYQKKNKSKSITKELEANVPEEHKTCLSLALKGKQLKKADSNNLLQFILGIMQPEGQEEPEVDEGAEDSEEFEKSDVFEDSRENLSQSPDKKSQSSQAANNEVLTNKPPTIQMCRFYKLGKCKFGKECRNEHPKFCKKFIKHGISKFSVQGCDGKCGKPHPSACRDSLRSKECSRENCRFYHIKGTNGKSTNQKEEEKKVKPQPIPSEKAQSPFLGIPNNYIQEMQQMQQMQQQMHQQMQQQMQQVNWFMSTLSKIMPNQHQEVLQKQNMEVFSQRMFPNSQ